MLGIRCDATLGCYLGLLVEIGKLKRQMFSFLKDRVVAKVEGWSEMQLNRAKHEVVPKLVVMALPTYVISCIKLPEGLCAKLLAIMGAFGQCSVTTRRCSVGEDYSSHVVKYRRQGHLAFLVLWHIFSKFRVRISFET